MNISDFINQLEKIISILEERCLYVETGLFKLLLTKYQQALTMIQSHHSVDNVNIQDGSMIFLKQASGYNDKLLIEINKAESMYERLCGL